MRLIDSEHDDGRYDAEAVQWLRDMSVAYLKGRDGEHDVELFNATEAQRNDHTLFAEHIEPVDGMFSQPLGDEYDRATRFINSVPTNDYTRAQSNYARLDALARVELREEAFAGGSYGKTTLSTDTATSTTTCAPTANSGPTTGQDPLSSTPTTCAGSAMGISEAMACSG